jgi:crossover junction endodeoxyribonuclease RusA
MYETTKAARPWMGTIAAAVAEFRDGQPATREPVALFCRFVYVRPLSHLKKSGGLTKGAPTMMVRSPDVDKLCRAVLDALTGVLFVNDSQVVRLVAVKEYGERARLELTYDVLDGEPEPD